MALICSCGHEVFSGNDCIPVEYDDEDIDFDADDEGPRFVQVTVMSVYCPACAKEGVESGRLRLQEGCGVSFGATLRS